MKFCVCSWWFLSYAVATVQSGWSELSEALGFSPSLECLPYGALTHCTIMVCNSNSTHTKATRSHTSILLPCFLWNSNIYISSSQSLAVKDPLKYSNSFWCFAISGPSQLRWKKNQTQKQTQGHGFMNFPSQVCEITTVHTLCRTVWFQQNHPSSFILNVSDIKYPIQNRVPLFLQSTFSIITKKIL